MPSGSNDDDEGQRRQGLSNTQKLQLEFWSEFVPRLRVSSKSVKPRRPSPQMWMDFAIGRADFTLEAFISVRERYVGISLAMLGSDAKAHYHQLHAVKKEIETELRETLTWHELPKKKSSYISLYRRDMDPNDRAKWPDQHKWMIDKLEAFHRCFSGRVKSLVVPSGQPVEPSV